ncbi:Craniofacial development protein 2 [Varanus komodoensis]|nr:Craniofacial development protein 2 [Varanus komodoensis]
MKVTVCFGKTGIVVPCKDGQIRVRDLTQQALQRYLRTKEKVYYCGQESLRRNGVAFIVNKRVGKAVLEYNLQNDRMISVSIQGKPFNITIVQVYAPTTDAEEAEIDQFYEGLQHLVEITPKNDVRIIMGDWNAKQKPKMTPHHLPKGRARHEREP